MRLRPKNLALAAVWFLLLALPIMSFGTAAAQADQAAGLTKPVQYQGGSAGGGSLHIRILSEDGEQYPPGNMLLIDPYGQALGFDSRSNRDYHEISGATYTQETVSSQQYAFLMNVSDAVSGTYGLRVIGVNPGRYLLTMDGYDREGNHANVRFTAMLEPGEVQHYVIRYSNVGGASIRARRTSVTE